VRRRSTAALAANADVMDTAGLKECIETFGSIAELERVFGALSQGGQALMPLGNYEMSSALNRAATKRGISGGVR
jgi:hypothetical protein